VQHVEKWVKIAFQTGIKHSVYYKTTVLIRVVGRTFVWSRLELNVRAMFKIERSFIS
jgi:hypothetical protein